MTLHRLTAEEERFRDEVREFFARELTPDLVAATDRVVSLFPPPSASIPWQRKLHARGWLAPHWPREHGGSGWSAMQRFIFDTEAGLAGAPLLGPFGLNYLGPVLVRFGTDAQRQRFLPGILSGEDYWCQGYSEPNAGSDLAGLQCAARRNGDEYVVRGTKLWTTHAHHANWIFCLVRTSTETRRQDGISFLLIDLRSKGVTVTPIISIAGEHETNQVFFDDVRVPADQLVGEEGQGWKIARYLLEFERGGFIMNGLLRRKFERCRALAARVFPDPTVDEARSLRDQLAEIDIDLLALEAAELQCALEQQHGSSPGPGASALKLEFSHLIQRIEEIAVALIGPGALAFRHGTALDAATADQSILETYLNNRATTIYGGSSEVQRELVARNLVGL